MLNNLTLNPAETEAVQTMSSREIAELCEKRHHNVVRDIRAMLIDLYGGDKSNLMHLGISMTYDPRGYVSEFHLDYAHTVTLITGYRADLRKRVIDRWMELERRKVDQPDPMQALRDPDKLLPLLQDYAERNKELVHTVEEQAPKVDAYNHLTRAEGTWTITESAKMLGVRPYDLRDWLKDFGWIYRRSNKDAWKPYALRVNDGTMDARTKHVPTPRGGSVVAHQARVTAKGVAKLAERVPGAVLPAFLA